MTGSIQFVGNDMYVEVNDAGTLEKLPRLRWWRQLYVAILAAIRPWHLDAIRGYCNANGRTLR